MISIIYKLIYFFKSVKYAFYPLQLLWNLSFLIIIRHCAPFSTKIVRVIFNINLIDNLLKDEIYNTVICLFSNH